MSYITARPESIEIRTDRNRLLGLIVLGAGMTGICWWVASHEIGGIKPYDLTFLLIYSGVGLFGLSTIAGIWQLLHAGEVIIRLNTQGVWLKGKGDGLTVPWALVDGVSRHNIKNQNFIVLQMSDENYARLYRGKVQSGIFAANKLLGIKGLPLIASGSSTSSEELESWVTGYWSDWKKRHGNSETGPVS